MLHTKDSVYSTSAPKAFLNWALLDDRFNYVQGGVTQIQTIAPGQSRVVLTASLPSVIPKTGYLYIYVSNESPQDVFFDNVTVQHHRGPLLQESHTYPFGLEMAAISSQAAAKLENRVRFQGQELQHKEFSDGSGLEMYGFKWRMDDPQIGRFWQIDPLAEKYDYNSPYAFSEDKVTSHVELEGLEASELNPSGVKEMIARQAEMHESFRQSSQQNSPAARNIAIGHAALAGVKHPETLPISNGGSSSAQIGAAVTPLPNTYSAYLQQENREYYNGQNGLNADGSQTFVGGLLNNNHFQKFAGNFALPLVNLASFASGEGEIASTGNVLLKAAETTESSSAYDGIRAASAYLKDIGVPREYRKQILQSFEINSISLQTADNSTYGLRFFGGAARENGRYLFPTFTDYTNRVGLALPPNWNSMTGLAQFQVNPGTTYIFGRAASQGGIYTGGSYQMYVNDLSNLIKVK